MKPITYLMIILFIVSCKKESKNTKLSGAVFGTSYSVIYDNEVNYEKQLDSLFYVINKSMSTYQDNSDISKLNRNEAFNVDNHFIKVFKASKSIYRLTEGAFDPTIGVVVNAWDFGPEGAVKDLDSVKINNLMQTVGLNKVGLINEKIIKRNSETRIDFNAIAKGYGVDVIAEFLEGKNTKNYLVEIGGEIRAKGLNVEKKSPWRVGIDKPNFDGSQSVYKAISLTDEAMATSGTYRKFKIDKNGNRYAHIIDTKTGYPSQTNLLGISVIAKDCMTADAYATAFKSMGIENVKRFLQSHPELKAFLIFENDKQNLESIAINGFPVD
ncbi:FAD:protein FMN transferase [Ichthyenterobacterium magnum]|uniref:FAD:protein FMN transferase n=1 Tax=Ichthyenterobacterium magnum TaxID=1230530 RepID=A0A420DVQ4_9FLAO|nr:FAD:protein FMN transferase [Ichthyenterobacterium magnum]RKE98308.1 thiamine biosynthesis lipoprotein [Ichthyenterobacterium magnum]